MSALSPFYAASNSSVLLLPATRRKFSRAPVNGMDHVSAATDNYKRASSISYRSGRHWGVGYGLKSKRFPLRWWNKSQRWGRFLSWHRSDFKSFRWWVYRLAIFVSILLAWKSITGCERRPTWSILPSLERNAGTSLEVTGRSGVRPVVFLLTSRDFSSISLSLLLCLKIIVPSSVCYTSHPMTENRPR